MGKLAASGLRISRFVLPFYLYLPLSSSFCFSWISAIKAHAGLQHLSMNLTMSANTPSDITVFPAPTASDDTFPSLPLHLGSRIQYEREEVDR